MLGEAVRRPQELHIGLFQVGVVLVVERAVFDEDCNARPLEHFGRRQVTVVQRIGEIGRRHGAHQSSH